MLTLKAPTFSNDALVGLYRALAAVRNHTATPNSAFGVSLARNAMRAHVEAVEDVMKLPEIADEFKVYEDARNKLLCEFANKDAAGEPVMVPINDKMSRFDVPADKQAAMTAALAVLNEANADLRARYADAVKAAEAFVQLPCEFDLSKIVKLPLTGFKDSTPGDLIDALFVLLVPPAPAAPAADTVSKNP